ncbi:Clavaminate synthase-like protein [Cutaneotrichosporon oleaginosum]|uniref:Clavaminate synthase-like protein n=1 Tax=Cutaneotrichosporon oleaginosum TaxID=879819 RepID=A0A0J1AZV1_9TREE|nr:Clavaminate synthase-like protein [Cutaneotrichosporon oleaginosum]KLT40879.1 Clavaminate synthase-like protein [Cutaneotrichosporon oleaginosum]
MTHSFPFPVLDLRDLDAGAESAARPHFRGYTRIGGERTAGKVDWREQIDIWSEDAALSPTELADLPPYFRMLGPNLWPAALLHFRDVVLQWQAAVVPAAHKLLRAWAEALGAPPDYFDKHFTRPSTRMKVVRYPGTEGEETGTLGVGAHKDGGCLTLLWVQPGAGGLQIRPGDEWVDAPPLEHGFVCNIGEMVERATAGYLKATVHRVVAPRAPAERISVPMFFNPSLDARFPALELPPDLRKSGEYHQDPDDVIHEVYGDNLLKSRLRAHPDVAAIHHPDLVQSGAY